MNQKSSLPQSAKSVSEVLTPDTEHDRAIAAENDGKLPHVNRASDRVRECRRIIGDAPRVEKQRLPVAAIVIWQRLNATGAPRLQAFAETLRQQGIGQRLNALWEQSEDGRGFDDREAGNGLLLLCAPKKSEPILATF
jgi:hypothetical protein